MIMIIIKLVLLGKTVFSNDPGENEKLGLRTSDV